MLDFFAWLREGHPRNRVATCRRVIASEEETPKRNGFHCMFLDDVKLFVCVCFWHVLFCCVFLVHYFGNSLYGGWGHYLGGFFCSVQSVVPRCDGCWVFFCLLGGWLVGWGCSVVVFVVLVLWWCLLGYFGKGVVGRTWVWVQCCCVVCSLLLLFPIVMGVVVLGLGWTFIGHHCRYVYCFPIPPFSAYLSGLVWSLPPPSPSPLSERLAPPLPSKRGVKVMLLRMNAAPCSQVASMDLSALEGCALKGCALTISNAKLGQ